MEPITLPDIEGLKAHVLKEVLDRVQRRTPVDTGRARDAWTLDGNRVVNKTPYIGLLENGTTTMEPVGMVRTTLEEVPDIINDYLRNTTR